MILSSRMYQKIKQWAKAIKKDVVVVWLVAKDERTPVWIKILALIVAAAHPPRGFAGRLHCRQKQRHEHANDCDDNEQFHQGETSAPATGDPIHYLLHWQAEQKKPDGQKRPAEMMPALYAWRGKPG